MEYSQQVVISAITGKPIPTEFEIYHPPPAEHRLELRDEYHQIIPTNHWKPSISYKVKLQDVKNQFTPSEYFKYRLQTSGKYIRMIQRLEKRWKKDYLRWHQATLKIQATYKGMKARRYFDTIKEELLLHLRQRRLIEKTNETFEKKDYLFTITLSLQTEMVSEELLTLQMKSHYRLYQYQECVQSADELLNVNRRNEEAAYFKACAFAAVEQYDNALNTLREIMSIQKYPSNHLFSLFGCLCFQVKPRLYESAIDTFSELINRDPRDFEALFERACCYSCLQEWTLCEKDLTTILAFRPSEKKVLLMRARMYTCLRKWDLANKDYRTLIRYNPSKQEEFMELIKAIEPFQQNALENYWESK